MSSSLNQIAAYKRDWVAECKSKISESELLKQATQYTPLDFADALAERISNKKNAVIAEIKKASPSKGIIRADFDPVAIASSYQRGGACCLSVLTDVQYFQGSDDYMRQIRQAVELPILRKDFMLDPYQVIEARAMGADGILLIMAMLSDVQAAELASVAREQGLSILPEVHNAEELQRALLLDTRLIGINNRNLHDFSISLQTSIDLLQDVPGDRVLITESGIHTSHDIAKMNAAGIHGFLVGESLMRQADPGAALTSLLKE
ncbi:MAG: indole-3-glycerol phosphate synthase TrpC [Mariprofundaceae bacterium]|nr:indole-3-glycerol phosphate synthase TrpC [Mariprofundaceae bacterium]